MRKQIVAGTALLLAGAMTAAPHFTAAQSSGAGWPTFHGDMTRDGVSSVSGPKTKAILNDFTGNNSAMEGGPAVDANGTAYVGDDSGAVYAFSPSHPTGPKWTFKTGGAVVDTPAVSKDGSTVFVGSDDGNVYALAASDGTKKWAVSVGSEVHGPPLVSSDGTVVYVAASQGTLYALNTSDGSTKWKYNPGQGAMPTGPAASPDGGTIYVVVSEYLYAVPASGPGASGNATAYDLQGYNGTTTPAVDQNGNIYVGSSGGYINCFTPTGQPCWTDQQHPVQGYPTLTSTPAFFNGQAIFGGGKYVYAISQSTGSQAWQFATSAGVNSSPAVASGNGMIYVGSGDGNLYALDSGGHQVFSRNMGAGVDASPAIAADGSVWAASRGGEVIRLQTPAAPPPIPTGTASGQPTTAPTATGTVSATAVPPTATITATTVPTIPLSFTLKGKVAPGKKQQITVTSAPNTDVHFRIQYPNGDHQSHKVTTNGSGTATYKFTQGASKVTHKNDIATVVATAGTGPASATATKTYAIGWGKIDVSAEPRTVAVGGTVDIFVHAPKGTRVVAYILPPKGKLVTRTGKTGKKGFASIKFKVTRSIVTASKRKVTVLAKVRNNPNIATRTTFTVS